MKTNKTLNIIGGSMSSSPEISKTDTEIVIKFPKHSDLDIKFYNPEIFHSLGFVGATVSLDTLEGDQTGGGLLDYQPIPEQPIEELSYPYRYFAYMFRGLTPKTNTPSPPQKQQDSAPQNGLIGTIMGLNSGDKKEEEESKPEEEEEEPKEEETKPSGGFFSMFLAKPKSNSDKSSSLFTGLTKNATVVEPIKQSPESNGNKVDNSGDNEPEPKPESLMETLFPSTKPEEPKPESLMELKPEEPKPESLMEPNPEEPKSESFIESLFSSTKPEEPNLTEPNPTETEPNPTEPKPKSFMESLFPSTKPEEPKSEYLFPSEEPTSESLPKSETPLYENKNKPDPLVSLNKSVPIEPPPQNPFGPVVTPFSAKWVIHIPLASNPYDSDLEPEEEEEYIDGILDNVGDIEDIIDGDVEGVIEGKLQGVIDNKLDGVLDGVLDKARLGRLNGEKVVSASVSSSAEKDSDAFDDVIVFAQMEARNGIYIRGLFIDIAGKRIKIGSVEQLSSNENNRTIKEYLSGREVLEGTKMQKYSMLMDIEK